MSISRESQSSAFGNVDNLSYSQECDGTDRVLVVGLGYVPTTESASVRYGGQDLTFAGLAQHEANVCQEVWYLVNPATGSNTLEASLSGVTSVVVSSAFYSGVKQTDPLYRVSSAAGKNVSALPFKSFSKVGAISIGIGSTDKEGASVSSLSASQTEDWNVQATGLNLRSQAISAQLPVDLDEIDVGNILDEAANWAVVVIGLEGA